jgi:glycosyltransferase involved in cell wall biosynthesis
MRNKLTVLIPCKNEQRNIRECIKSVQDVADEILVADSGSTDGTQDIVRSIDGCRLIEREFVTYADFKNWALPQASHSWVLLVDADERMTDPLAQEILSVLHNPPEDVDGYWIGFNCFFMGHRLNYSGWNTASVRLVRRDCCRYKARRVHEGMQIDKQRIRHLRGKLQHFSYWNYDQYFAKYIKYTRWGAEELADRGQKASWYSLAVRPALRFLHIYALRGGFLDGLPGLQICVLTAFFNTFMKQARLWEMEHALRQPDPEVHNDAASWPNKVTRSRVVRRTPNSSPHSSASRDLNPGMQVRLAQDLPEEN